MFITTKERVGTGYLEFQFCKRKHPIIFNKVATYFIKNWEKDSLLISDEDFGTFCNLYGNILNCALFPNGKKGFDFFGINYYDKQNSEKILFELRNVIDDKYFNLIDWLEETVEKYNGFYILGL